MNLNNLKKEIPYKWKVQTAKEWGCDCVAYIDARDVMDILDEVVGPENWQDSFREIGGKMYCTLSIKIGDTWVSKEDIGTPSNMDADKGEASDAFKRAAVKWGIGRFLYDLGIERVKSTPNGNKFVPADEYGKRIYNLTEYINNRKTSFQPKGAPAGKQPEQKTGYTPTPKADAADSQGMSTIGQREEIQELCAEKNSGGKKFQDLLKEQNFTWAKLTYSQAETVIKILKAM